MNRHSEMALGAAGLHHESTIISGERKAKGPSRALWLCFRFGNRQSQVNSKLESSGNR
jgi:hypothetical protein